jgi:hypothetical protein
VQLFFDNLECAPERRAARQGLREVNRARIKSHREQAREPAERAREVHIRKNFLAAMTLKINQHRSAGASTTPPAPVRNSQHQAGQKNIVDATMKRRRHPRQQRPRDRSRQCERELPGPPADIARRIERALNQ